MNHCHTCMFWRRLTHWRNLGLCKKFTAVAVNAVAADAIMAMVPNPSAENSGLPTDGVITGFLFGCIHHPDNPPVKEQTGSFC